MRTLCPYLMSMTFFRYFVYVIRPESLLHRTEKDMFHKNYKMGNMVDLPNGEIPFITICVPFIFGAVICPFLSCVSQSTWTAH